MAGVQRLDIASSTIWRALLIAALLWFVYVISDFLLMLFGAIIFSAAIEPAVNQLQRLRVPRGVSVLLIYVIIIGIFSLAVTLLIPPLVEQSRQLLEGLPQIVARADQWLQVVPEEIRFDLAASLQEGVLQFGERIANVSVGLVEQTRTVMRNIFTLFFFLVITFYLTVEKDVLKKVVRLVVSHRHVAYVESRIDRMKRQIGLWVVGQLSLAVIMGVLSGVGLWLLGARYALVLGIVAGILELIPILGPIISGTFAVLLSLTQSLWLGLSVLVFYIVIQQLESSYLIPKIMKRTTGLHALVIIVAVLLGARLGGVVGILLAVPTATIAAMLWQDIFLAEPAAVKRG